MRMRAYSYSCSLLFIDFISRTELSNAAKNIACGIFVAGTLAQSGGFFIHMSKGQPDTPSIGTKITTIGALLLTSSIGILIYGIVTTGLGGVLPG